MKRYSITALLLFILVLHGMAQLSSDQASFLASARQAALAYTQKLPDFICTQITHREVALLDIDGASPPDTVLRSAGSWSRQPIEQNDSIEERLTFFDQKEKYEVIKVDGKKADGATHLQFQGAISIGEFGTDLRRVFAPESETAFTWDRIAELRGHRVYVFHFNVPEKNGSTVVERERGQRVVVAYDGQVFIDPDTLNVLRISSRLEMPAGFPIRAGERMIEYKPVRIGSKEFTLPFHAEIRMRDAKHAYVNRIDFTNYHKFVTESTIHYDSANPQ